MTPSADTLRKEIKALRDLYTKDRNEYTRGLANSLIWVLASIEDKDADLIPQYVPPTMGAIIGRALRK